MILRAVVTAGGTSEKIDDVRVVTNLSSGRLGACIAEALAEQGVRTELITSGVVPESGGRALKVVRTASTADLQQAIHRAAEQPIDLFLMAAAVSDYAPEQASGKIRSDADELVVKMGRAPKILPTLRGLCGEQTFIVGFKLLSGVSRGELVATARRQILGADTDACFANDLHHLGPDWHPAILVLPEAELDLTGDKPGVARALVQRLLNHLDPWGNRRLAPAQRSPTVEWTDPGAWARARDALRTALDHSGIDPRFADDPNAVPLMADGGFIGLIVAGPAGEAVPFILPEHRGRGIGDVISERLAERKRHVLVPRADRGWWCWYCRGGDCGCIMFTLRLVRFEGPLAH